MAGVGVTNPCPASRRGPSLRRGEAHHAACGNRTDRHRHPALAHAGSFARRIARAQQRPAQGHRPQARGRRLRISEVVLALRLTTLGTSSPMDIPDTTSHVRRWFEELRRLIAQDITQIH